MLKTLAYVVVALAVAYGLLRFAWNVSEDVMKQPEQEAVSPPVQPKIAPQPEPTPADAAGGTDAVSGTDEKPAVDTSEPAQPAASQAAPSEGYYDDGVQSEPSAIKQHRNDKADPYEPDEREADKETEPVPFPTDDREEDRPADAEAPGESDIDTSTAYEPDDREAN